MKRPSCRLPKFSLEEKETLHLAMKEASIFDTNSPRARSGGRMQSE